MNKPEKQLTRAKRDVTRTLTNGEKRAFPSFESLAQWAVTNGYAKSVEEISSVQRELWPDLLFEWYVTGQIACIFAVHLAKNRELAHWRSVVLDENWTADILTAIVDAHVTIGAQGLQILFPGDVSAQGALKILSELASHPRWHCEDTGWLGNEQGDSIHVGLRWTAEDGSYESWAVGIAPFDPMPFTRQFVGAPFIALVLRPLPPADERAPTPTGNSGIPASHLAHMDDMLGEKSHVRDLWFEHTKTAKRALIYPEPLSRARAKVTFSFPSDFTGPLQALTKKT